MGGSSPYVGMLLATGFSFAPLNWVPCDGRLLSIAQYDALFSLIGTTYGGNGQTTFGVPDLRGRTPLHTGSGYVLGQVGGVETVTLTTGTIPVHNHVVSVTSSSQTAAKPNNNYLAAGPQAYATGVNPNTTLASSSIAPAGGTQPHSNLQPYLTLNWIISLFGVYPSQS